MSFGFSIGDFVCVGQLAWQIYRKCKSASSEFKSISSQLISLHIVFKDVNETIEEWGLPESKQTDLLQIAEESKETLDELDQLLKKYSGLGMKSSRTLDRLRYPRAHVDELRTRLESYINMLSSFKISLVLYALVDVHIGSARADRFSTDHLKLDWRRWYLRSWQNGKRVCAKPQSYLANR
jgi:hypothetical protein